APHGVLAFGEHRLLHPRGPGSEALGERLVQQRLLAAEVVADGGHVGAGDGDEVADGGVGVSPFLQAGHRAGEEPLAVAAARGRFTWHVIHDTESIQMHNTIVCIRGSMPAPPPPGPRAPALLQALRIGLDPVGYLSSLRDRYGPAFTVRYPGFAPEVYVTTAELAEKVYALDAGGGRAGEVRRAFLEPVVGPHSLLNLDGAPWMRHRKLLSPPLRGRAVSGYRGEITRIAADAMDGWPTGEPVTLLDLMQQITLEVIMRLVFGIRDLRRRDRLRMLLPKLLQTG